MLGWAHPRPVELVPLGQVGGLTHSNLPRHGMHLGREALDAVQASLYPSPMDSALSGHCSSLWSAHSPEVSPFAGPFLEALVPSVSHSELEGLPQSCGPPPPVEWAMGFQGLSCLFWRMVKKLPAFRECRDQSIGAGLTLPSSYLSGPGMSPTLGASPRWASATQGGPELLLGPFTGEQRHPLCIRLHKGVTMSVKKKAIYSNAANSVPAQLTQL